MAHCCHDDAPEGIKTALPDLNRLRMFCNGRTSQQLEDDLGHVYLHCEVERRVIERAIDAKRNEEAANMETSRIAQQERHHQDNLTVARENLRVGKRNARIALGAAIAAWFAVLLPPIWNILTSPKHGLKESGTLPRTALPPPKQHLEEPVPTSSNVPPSPPEETAKKPLPALPEKTELDPK